MRCFRLRIDPLLVKGTNTEAIVFAPNASQAKTWGERRWHVAADLLQAEPVGMEEIPAGTKPVDVTKTVKKAVPRQKEKADVFPMKTG
jgi:hypothetical protein